MPNFGHFLYAQTIGMKCQSKVKVKPNHYYVTAKLNQIDNEDHTWSKMGIKLSIFWGFDKDCYINPIHYFTNVKVLSIPLDLLIHV